MLIVTRKLYDELFVDIEPSESVQTVVFKIMDIKKNNVRVGVIATKDSTIFKDDILTTQQIEEKRKRATRDKNNK